MSETETTPAPDPALAAIAAEAEAYARADPRAAREDRHVRMLRDMQDQDMELAGLLMEAARRDERLRALAEQQQDPAPTSRLEGIVRARASLMRSTRQLMQLEIQIDDGRWDRQAGIVREVSQAHRRKAEAADHTSVGACIGRMHVKDIVEQAIAVHVDEAGITDPDAVDELINGAYLQLNDPALEKDLHEECTGLMADRICKTLGFSPDWNRWADHDWAIEEAERRSEGSPFRPPERVVTDEEGRFRFSCLEDAVRETGPP